jgi:hypothetical protein
MSTARSDSALVGEPTMNLPINELHNITILMVMPPLGCRVIRPTELFVRLSIIEVVVRHLFDSCFKLNGPSTLEIWMTSRVSNGITFRISVDPCAIAVHLNLPTFTYPLVNRW